VVTLRDEDLAGGAEQLRAAGHTRQPGAARAGLGHGHGGPFVGGSDSVILLAGNRRHQVWREVGPSRVSRR
jgi:hypothetical protein